MSIHILEKCNTEVLEFKENTTRYMKTHVEMSGAAKTTMYVTPLFKAFFVIIPISCKSQGMCVYECSVISESEKVKKFGMRNFESKSNNSYMTMTKATDLSFHIHKLGVAALSNGWLYDQRK